MRRRKRENCQRISAADIENYQQAGRQKEKSFRPSGIQNIAQRRLDSVIGEQENGYLRYKEEADPEIWYSLEKGK
ncbi:MAG: hypothetical protein KIY10_02940 [Thermoplasmata archaeon]|nr:hypothetical protein [Candidatus Sysuiplasma jiujiangense]